MSKNKILICPDTHGRNAVKEIKKYLERDNTYTEIICLGDYVDSFYLSDKVIYDNLSSLIELAKEDKRITLLIGNHDQSYMWPVEGVCS